MIEYFSLEDHLISSQTDTHINMQSFIYFFLALVALSSAKQLENGPQILSEDPSSSEPSQKNDKRSVTQEFNLYFSPEKVHELQTVKSSQNAATIETLKQNLGSKEFYNELIQKYYAENLKPAPIEKPQAERARSLTNFFYPKEESVYNNKPNFRQLLMDQTKLSGHTENLPKNKYNQASPSVTDSALSKLASGVNRNEDKRTSEKEIEYFLRNLQIYQPRQFNSPTQVRIQNNGRKVGLKKSAVEKEIENAWRQHQAFEFERSNPPADISKQSFSLSASDENSENTEGWEQIKYILKNGQVYGLERTNAPAKANEQGSQDKNELQKNSEVEMEMFRRKQQDPLLQKSFSPVEVFSQGLSDLNENKLKSKVEKQIENIFTPLAFEYKNINSPLDVISQSSSGRNENQDNKESEKVIKFLLKHLEAENERQIAPKVYNERSFLTNKYQDKLKLEKEIQNILKKHQDFEFQRSKSAAVANNQSPPIKILEHVSISKHVAVPILKAEEVSVPTPVLVPIAEPYPVKVTHLYPVPFKVVTQY